MLDRLKIERGLPLEIGIDQGPEFTSKILMGWAKDNGVNLNAVIKDAIRLSEAHGTPFRQAMENSLQTGISRVQIEHCSGRWDPKGQ